MPSETSLPNGADAPKQFLLTREGLEQRRRTFEVLRTDYRPGLVHHIRRARLMLTPEEGAARLSGLQADLETADRQIAELELIVEHATVIGDGPAPETVQPGFGVTVGYDDGDKATMTLVWPLEADLSRNYIAVESPVGRALLGKSVGAKVTAEQGGTGTLAFSYRVVARRKDIAGPRLERVDVRPVESRQVASSLVPGVDSPSAAAASGSSPAATPTQPAVSTATPIPAATSTSAPTSAPSVTATVAATATSAASATSAATATSTASAPSTTPTPLPSPRAN